MRSRLSVLIVFGLIVAGCSSTTGGTTQSVETVVTVTTTAPTVVTTTSTTTPPTTTSTTLPSPSETRAAFMDSLDASGWTTFTDPIAGWSIKHPSDWNVIDEAPGESYSLETSDSQALFIVSLATDALDDTGSLDYLIGSIDFAVTEGILRQPADDSWFSLDHDFDGETGLLDIEGVEASLARDGEGNLIPEDSVAPVWWYAYYNPDLRPRYGYIFQTIGISPILFQNADDIVLSFQPPGS